MVDTTVFFLSPLISSLSYASSPLSLIIGDTLSQAGPSHQRDSNNFLAEQLLDGRSAAFM